MLHLPIVSQTQWGGGGGGGVGVVGGRKPCRRQVEVRQCSRVAPFEEKMEELRRGRKGGEGRRTGGQGGGGSGGRREGRLLASHRASQCHPPPQYRSGECVYTPLCECVWMRHTWLEV